MNLSRRELLRRALFGAGLLGLRSLATGLPMWFLADPRKALAASALAPACAQNPKSQYLILSTSENGDPVNANVPGTYGDPNIIHPADPAMAPTALSLAGTASVAAAPWAALPQWVLDRTCFFHHGTYTVVHPDERRMLSVMGNTAHDEMLVSIFTQQLSGCLNTVQTEPISLGAEALTFQGRPQPLLTPTSLALSLTTPSGPEAGPLAKLQRLRDRDLDALNALARREGTPAQRDFIDRYARSQGQVRSISQSLMGQLAAIPDDGPSSQLQAALVLIQMNVSPVITIHLPFGGDNHYDPNLAGETAATVAGVSLISQFQQQLQTLGLADRVSFAMMNVFGRTLALGAPGPIGRNHLGTHHCTVMIGKPFKGSVIGGAEPAATDYQAQSISSATGLGVPGGGGDVPFTDTLASVAKTLGAAVGVDPGYLASNITGGQVIKHALS